MPSREKMKQNRKNCGHCGAGGGYLRRRTDGEVGRENVCRRCEWITPVTGVRTGVAWKEKEK